MRAAMFLCLILTGANTLLAQRMSPVVDQGSVRSIVVDGKEVWIATDHGAFRARNGDVRLETDEVRVNIVAAVANKIWLGTEVGLMVVGEKGNRRIYETSIGSLGVRAILDAGSGVFVGTNRGLYVLSKDKADLTPVRDPVYRLGLAGSEVLINTRRNVYRWVDGEPMALLPEPHSVVATRAAGWALWALTLGGYGLPGPVFRIDSWQPTEFVPEPDQPFSVVEILTVSEVYGEVYFGTTRGLRKLLGEHLDPVLPASPRMPVNVIVPFRDGMLLGTTRGLFWQRRTGEEFQRIGAEEDAVGLAELNIKEITLQGDVAWLATSTGAFRVDFREGRGLLADRVSRSLVPVGGAVAVLLLAILAGLWFSRSRLRRTDPRDS